MRTLLVSTACLTSLAVSAVQPEFTAFPESGAAFNILNNGATYLTLNFMGWGRQWSHIGKRGSAVAQGGGTRAVCRGTVRDTDARITLE